MDAYLVALVKVVKELLLVEWVHQAIHHATEVASEEYLESLSLLEAFDCTEHRKYGNISLASLTSFPWGISACVTRTNMSP
jgi:hypothetical protein